MLTTLHETTSQARDFCALTKSILALCEPYGPVHSFKLVHNSGAARVACIIELESTKEEQAQQKLQGELPRP